MNLSKIQKKLADFAKDRNWDQFHSPKNLSMALVAEAAELLEIFQWLTEEQSREIINRDCSEKKLKIPFFKSLESFEYTIFPSFFLLLILC